MHALYSFYEKVKKFLSWKKKTPSPKYVVFLARPKNREIEKLKRRLWKIFHRNTFKSATAACVVFILLIVLVRQSIFIKAEVVKFYPNACLGGWQNTVNAEGKPDLAEDATAEEFSDKNSAVLGNIVSQIFCSDFVGEIPKDTHMKGLLLKLSWAPELGVSVSNKNTPSTITVYQDDDTSESIQEIIDAPASTTLALPETNRPEEIKPQEETNIQEQAVSGGDMEQGEQDANNTEQPADSAAQQETNDKEPAANDTGASASSPNETPPASVSETPEAPPAPPPAETPPPTESAPVSFFDRLFQHVFAEEIPPEESAGEPVVDSTVSEPSATSESTPSIITVYQDDDTSESIQEIIDAPASTTLVLPETNRPEEETVQPQNDATTTETAATEQEDNETTEQPNDAPSSPEFLEVLYTLDGTEWHSLGKVSREDWKAEFTIPLTEWEDISKLQISIQSFPSVDVLPKVYLDGMWLEAEYGEVESEIADDASKGPERKIVRSERVFKVSEKDFSADETPGFEIYPTLQPGNEGEQAEELREKEERAEKQAQEKDKNIAERVMERISAGMSQEEASLGKDSVVPEESIATTTDTADKTSLLFPLDFIKTAGAQTALDNAPVLEPVKTELLDWTGVKTSVVPVIEEVNGVRRVNVPRFERGFSPGKYTLRAEFTDGEVLYVAEREFYWGVLAVNVNKSVYHSGEKAYIQMAALDNNGHTLCNEPLELSITDPKLNTKIFSTKDGRSRVGATSVDDILFGDECGVDNVTDKPDYFLHYAASTTGTYLLTLTNKNTNNTVESRFYVQDNPNFDVERVGATRINPWKSSSYTMKLIVKANQDFSGSIVESVPASFDVVLSESKFSSEISTDGDVKYIQWEAKNVKKGDEFTLSYAYEAPKISPQIFLLGPLKFMSGGFFARFFGGEKINFEEARQWQLASDAVNVKVRQEINIIDGYLGAASDAYATSSAIIQIDTTKYTSPAYYLEVVASSSASLAFVVELARTTGATTSTVFISSASSTGYERFRSASFTPTTGANDYVVRVGNASGGAKGAIAARVIVLQDATTLSSTQTQIEIGNSETYTSSATSTFTSPKYWYYDSAKWDGAPTFYAEVTYKAIAGVASSTTYSAAGTFTVSLPSGTASTSVELWGGGGAGDGTNANSAGGYGGGGGGAYTKSNLPGTTTSHTLVIGAAAAGNSTTAASPSGATTTWDGAVVKADGGIGAGNGTPKGRGGLASLSIGDTKFDGGDGSDGMGVAGNTGAGGEGGGSTANGGDASGITAGTGTDGGDGGAGRLAVSEGNGNAGTAPGGGGGGANMFDSTDHTGGNGALGRAIITNYIATTSISLQMDDENFSGWTTIATIVGAGSLHGDSVRVRSPSFVPTSGRNYRIAFNNGTSGATFAIYNAKIVVDQTSPTLLEPQYLLANTTFAAGTSLQQFNTLYDSTELTTTNTVFIHETDSVSGGTSDVKLQDTTGPTDISGSTITDVIQRERSTALTMPPTGREMDVIATTNNDNLYASRILIQMSVGGFLTERAHIFLNDDGNGTATTTDTYTRAHSAATSSSISNVKKGERLIVRIQIDNTGFATSTNQYRLQYDKNDDTWVDVATTTEIRTSLSVKGVRSGRPDGVPLPTRQVTESCNASAPTYQEGRFVAGTATSTAFSIGPAQCTEIAYAFETSGATLGQLYRLRVVKGANTGSLDAYSLPYPTFTIESTRTLTYSKEARGTYATSSLDISGSVGQSTSLTIGIDGFPVLVSHSPDGFFRFAKCNDPSCASVTKSTIDSSGTPGLDSSIAIGVDGFPVMSYYDLTSKHLKFAKCNDIGCTSPALTTLDTSTSDTGLSTSLAIGSDGYPVISYIDFTASTMVFAKCKDISCASLSTTTIATANDNGRSTSITIGIDGYPIIVYSPISTGWPTMIKCNDTSCSTYATANIDTVCNSNCSDPAVAIGTDGYPVVSYFYNNGGYILKFAKCNNASCTSVTTSTLDSASDVGRYTSLQIGIDGYPVISYYRTTSGDLKFAKCNNIGCTSFMLSTLDEGDDIGQATSMAIGADGFPVIGYYRVTGSDLGFLKCNSIDCASGASSTANLPANAQSYDTYLDDRGYNDVASSDNTYDSLSAATSSRLAYNFKKYNSDTSAQITVTWEGQVSVSTTTTLQIYNNSSGLWETVQTNTSPTANSDFTLTGNVSGTAYYDGSNIVTTRAVTGTTTAATTLKTDQITVAFSAAISLTQRAHIFLNDDGNGTATTTDTYTRSHSAATSSSISNVKIGERIVARIQIDNTGTATSTAQYRLQWASSTAENGTYGSWYDTDTTTEIKWSLSQKGALWGRPDGVPLPTAQLGVAGACVQGGTTYQEGRFVAGTATSTTFGIGPSRCTEIAYAVETSSSTLGTWYRLRVMNGTANTEFGAYSVYPKFQIESTRTLTYSKESRGSYATTTLDSLNSTGIYSSIAIGIDGYPVVSYHDSTVGDLKFAKCNDISCSSFTVSVLDSSDGAGQDTSIAIGIDGFPVISYQNISTFELKFAKCNDISCTSSATSTIDSLSNYGVYTSIAIGTDGFPVIGYQDADLGLKVAKCNNISCSSFDISFIDASYAQTGYYPSLAIGTDGFPVISYQDLVTGDLKFAKCNNASCTSAATSTLDSFNNTGFSTALAIGADGYPVVSYYDITSGDLEFAKCNDISCISVATSTLDSLGDTGAETSIAIGTDGYPVISYHYQSVGALKFAKCNNVSCTSVATSTIDSLSVPGTTSFIAIGTDGFPIITYQDQTASDLKFAKCNNSSCSASTSPLANLPANAQSYDTYLDDVGYSNVASSDNTYDFLSAATSSRLAYNFKKASSTNTDQITVTWEGQVSVSTTTTLQIYNNSSGLWETLQTNTSPTANSDFTLTGNVTGTAYYDGSNIVTTRAVTGTTTKATVMKTDQVTVAFGAPATQSLTFSVSNNSASFGALSSSVATYASSTAAGDTSDLADAHTISVSTNASGGYILTVNGTTLTSGVNTIATSSTAAASSPGTEQFGLRLVVNSGNGSATAPYSTANQFAFDSLNFPDQVASGNGDDVTTVFGARYIGNISANTEAGSYGTTLTYIATGTF